MSKHTTDTIGLVTVQLLKIKRKSLETIFLVNFLYRDIGPKNRQVPTDVFLCFLEVGEEWFTWKCRQLLLQLEW